MRALVYRDMRAVSAAAVGEPVSHCSVLSVTNSWSMAKAGRAIPKTAAVAAPRKALRDDSAFKDVLDDCVEDADGANAEETARVDKMTAVESFMMF